MANDKTLMSSISNNLNKIVDNEKKRFGTKMPSNENKDKDMTLESLVYSQMTMAAVASMTWGKKSLQKTSQVKNLLNKPNIFDLVESIAKSIDKKEKESIYTIVNNGLFEDGNINKSYLKQIKNILKDDLISQIDENHIFDEERFDRLQDNIKTALNYIEAGQNDISKLIKNNDEKSSKESIITGRIVFDGNNSVQPLADIISFFDELCKPLKVKNNKVIKDNLKTISQIINDKSIKSSLISIFNSLDEIVNEHNNDKNLNNINDSLHTIISIITLEKEKINKDSIKLIRQITDPNNGLLKTVIDNIKKLSEDASINIDAVNAIQDFFDAIITMCSLGEYSFTDLYKLLLKINLINDIVKDNIIGNDKEKGIIFYLNNLDSKKLNSIISKLEILDNVFDSLNTVFDHMPTLKSIIVTLAKLKLFELVGEFTIKILPLYKTIIDSLKKITLTSNQKTQINSIIDIIERLEQIKLNFSKIFQGYRGLKILHKSTDRIKEIIDSLKDIKEEDLKISIAIINSFNKLVLIASATMIIGALSMTFIKPINLILYTACLGLFIWGLSKIYSEISNELIDNNLEIAESFSKLVAISGLILIAGGLVMNFIKPSAIFSFALSLGMFIIMVSAAYLIASHSAEASLESADKFAILIGVSAATLILGGLTYKYIGKYAIDFALLLGVFIGAISLAYNLATIKSRERLYAAKNLSELVAISAAVLMIGGLFMLSDKLAFGAVKFGGLLVVFIGLVCLAFKLMPKDIKTTLNTMIGLSVFIAISASVLMLGGLLMSSDKIANGALRFAGLLAGFVTIMALIAGVLSIFEEKIKKGVIIMSLLVIVTTGFAIALGIVALVARIMPKDIWSKLLVMGTVIVVLAAICGIIGIPQVALCVALGAIVMVGLIIVLTLMSVAFIVLAKAVKVMGDLDETSVNSAFTNIKAAINGLLDLWWPLTKLSAGLVTMWPGIIAIFVLSGALSKVAQTIKLWADLRIPVYNATGTDIIGYKTLASEDFDAAIGNIKDVLLLLFGTVKQVYNENGDLFSFNLTTFFTGKTPAERVISSTMNLGKMLINLASGVQSWAKLKIPIYNDKGQIVGYKTIDDNAFEAAGNNIKSVITALGIAISDIYDEVQKDPNTKGMFESDEWFGLGRTKFSKVVNAMKTMGPMLQSVAKGIQAWVDLRVPQYNSKGEIIGYIPLKDTQLTNAGENIKKVLICIGESIVKTVKGNEQIFGGDTLVTDSPAIVAAEAMKIMGETLNLTAFAVASYASGRFPVFDKDGKKIDEFKVTNLDLYWAGFKIKQILTCIGNVIVDVTKSNPELFSDGILSDSPALQAAEAIKNMSEALNNTIVAITKISELKMDDLVTALDPNGTDNVYTKLKNLIGFTIDIYKLFAASNENTDKKRALWGIGWKLDENRSFAEYLNAHNSDIEDAADALGTFTSTINKMLNEYSKIGNIIRSKTEELNVFEGDVNSYAYRILHSIMITTTQIINVLLDKNRLDKLEDFKDNEKDIKNGINSIISVTTTLLKGIVSVKSLSDKINDYDLFTTLKPIISSFNNCIGILQTIGQNNIDLNGQIGNFKLDILDSNAKEFNENIRLYTDALKLIIDVNEYAKNSDENGFAKHVKTLDKYVKVINSIKLTNINSLRGFVESMNELSTRLGNLDDLTEAISDKLSAVLYELVCQLRKAEATITNAHELQEKRKKLMDESIAKIQGIMDQPMRVEISQATGEKQSNSNPSIINSNIVTPGTTGEDTSPKETTMPKENPEEATVKKPKGNISTGGGSGNKYDKDIPLTYVEFITYMEEKFIKNFKS